jgi:hypothetical protein
MICTPVAGQRLSAAEGSGCLGIVAELAVRTILHGAAYRREVLGRLQRRLVALDALSARRVNAESPSLPNYMFVFSDN